MPHTHILEAEYLVIAVFPPGTPGIELNGDEFVWCSHYTLRVALEMAKSMLKHDGALWVEITDFQGNVVKQCVQSDVIAPWRQA